MSHFQRIRRRVMILATLLTGIAVMPAMAQLPGNQALRYSVDYRGSDAGEIEVVLEHGENGFQVTSISHLSLLASMFLESHTIESRFSLEKGLPVLDSGSEILTQTGEVKRSFAVDRQAMKVEFSAGDPVVFDQATRLDADSFPLGLVTSPVDALKGRRFLSVNPKRARLFEVTDVTRQTIRVPAGEFEAWRVDSSVPGEPTRVFRLWLRAEGERIPLRIETGREGKLTTMLLQP